MMKKLSALLLMALLCTNFISNNASAATVTKSYSNQIGSHKYTMTDTGSYQRNNVLVEYLTDYWNSGASSLTLSQSKGKSLSVSFKGDGDDTLFGFLKAGFSISGSVSKTISTGATFPVDSTRNCKLAFTADYDITEYYTKYERWISDTRVPENLRYQIKYYNSRAAKPKDMYAKVIYQDTQPIYQVSDL